MKSHGPNGRNHGEIIAFSEPSSPSSSDAQGKAFGAAAAALYEQLPTLLNVVLQLAIEEGNLTAAKLLLDLSGLAAYLKSLQAGESDPQVEYAGPREIQMLKELEEQIRGLMESQRKTDKK